MQNIYMICIYNAIYKYPMQAHYTQGKALINYSLEPFIRLFFQQINSLV